jgi:Uma2 family endonuclease
MSSTVIDFNQYVFIDKDEEMSRVLHSRTVFRLSFFLAGFLTTSDFSVPPGSIYPDLDVVFPRSHRRLRPDLVWLAHPLTDEEDLEAYHGVPDVVFEVVSASSYQEDAVVKKRFYASESVPEYWLIFPETKTIHVYHLQGTEYVLSASATEKGKVASSVIEGWQVSVESMFM